MPDSSSPTPQEPREPRCDASKLSLLIEHGFGEGKAAASVALGVALDLRDCRAALAERTRERDEAREDADTWHRACEAAWTDRDSLSAQVAALREYAESLTDTHVNEGRRCCSECQTWQALEPKHADGCVLGHLLADTAAAARAFEQRVRAEAIDQAKAACQRVAQGFEGAAAAVGAFETPREMAARKCVDAVGALLAEPEP